MFLYTARFFSPFYALKCQQSYFQENPEMEKKSRLKHYTKPDCQDEPQGNIVKSEYWHSPSSMIKGKKQNETKKMSPNESILTIKYEKKQLFFYFLYILVHIYNPEICWSGKKNQI